jgi:hypothetical protein
MPCRSSAAEVSFPPRMAPENKKPEPSDPRPTEPALPREGFDDAQRLAELRRQAQQRLREEAQAASNVPTDPHGVPVAPVYGGPPFRPSPSPSPSEDNRVNQTVYGAPPFRDDVPRPSDTAPHTPVAAVYGGPPPEYRPPYPAPAYGGAPRPVPEPASSVRIVLIAIGVGIAILIAAWVLKHLL